MTPSLSPNAFHIPQLRGPFHWRLIAVSFGRLGFDYVHDKSTEVPLSAYKQRIGLPLISQISRS